MTPDDINAADGDLCGYIMHITRHVALEIYATTKFRNFVPAIKSIEGDLTRLRTVKRSFVMIEEQFLQLSSRSENTRRFLRDLKLWRGTCTEQIDDLTAELNDLRYKEESKIRELQLQESKRSIEEAISVKRLSMLATIFLPLSFTSSVFGMNVVQLGTGKVQIWIFIVVAVSITLSTFVVFTVIQALHRATLGIIRFRRQWKELYVSPNPPVLGLLWLFWFLLLHSSPESHRLFIQVGKKDAPKGAEDDLKPALTWFPSFWAGKAVFLKPFGRTKVARYG
jgi:hypothetical protein